MDKTPQNKDNAQNSRAIPLQISPVPAGFPSPAEDYIDRELDLHRYMVDHPAATFFVTAKGDSMKDAGIIDGSILVIDRKIEPAPGKIVIAAVGGELTVKRYVKDPSGRPYLKSENPAYKDIPLDEDSDIKGVVIGWAYKI
jgi:DNA polymerase V